MSEFLIERARIFPSMRASDPLILVVPDGLVDADALRRVTETLELYGDRKPTVIASSAFEETQYRDSPLIVFGHLTNNTVIERLYNQRCCFVDTYFPGPDGYFIKSVSDPLGYGHNAVVVGASANTELLAALSVFENLIHDREGDLTRLHAHRFGFELPPAPGEDQIEEMIKDDLAVWDGSWVASPFRGGKLGSYLWNYYLTDHPEWGRVIPPIFAGSIAPFLKAQAEHPESYHTFFGLHNFIHLWNLVEDSPLYTKEDRHGVVEMFSHLLDHLARLFYLRPEVNPAGEPRQNHSTFIGLNLAVGHAYLVSRYDRHALDGTVEAIERIFEGQVDTYKPNDDAGVGYTWQAPRETFLYYRFKNDDRYLSGGPVSDLCRLAVLTTDNMRSEVCYGDAAGYSAFNVDNWSGHLWPLMAATWRFRNPEDLWALNWLGEDKKPELGHTLNGLYAGVGIAGGRFTLDGVVPAWPDALTGIQVMNLPESALRWVDSHTPPAHRPLPEQWYFDKISLRASFDPQDEYLLLEGTGTFCHGHEDTNAILRLTWHNRAWLADGDYIRAAPKYHNSITVLHDGVGVLASPGDGVVIPPLASVAYENDSPAFGLLTTEAAGYNGVNWHRSIVWTKGLSLLVVDQLHAIVGGDYRFRCLWRLVGEIERTGATTRLRQQGEAFFLHNLDSVPQELIPDAHTGSQWTTYPHADGPLHELHQTVARRLDPGQDCFFVNLLTPHPDVTALRLGERLVKLTDGITITVVGIGSATLGAVTVEGSLFVLTASDSTLSVQGVERLAHQQTDGTTVCESFDGAFYEIELKSSAVARHLKTVMGVASSLRSPGFHPISDRRTGGLQVEWTARVGAGQTITTLDANDDIVLCGTHTGDVVQLSTNGGEERWRASLTTGIGTVKLADDGEAPIAVVGTLDSELVLLTGATGEERWRRPLKTLGGRAARVADIAVARLRSNGPLCILAGNEGWYLDAFTTDGEPLWATWVRYHPITRLLVEDIDGDGIAEVMVGNIYSTPLSVHNADGSFRWSTLEQVGAEGNATTPRRGIHLTQMLLADVNGDGMREIVYGTADGWLYAVSAEDGAEYWRVNIVGAVTGMEATATGLAVSSEFGVLYRFDLDGRMRWYTQVATHIRGLALAGEETVVLAADGLLRHDAQGNSTGSLVLPAEPLLACSLQNGLVCALADGTIVRVRLG